MTMRIAGFGAAVVLAGLATGCTSQEMHFEQRSELATQASNVVLYDQGRMAHGSMNAQTCQVDTIWGSVVQDWDLPTDYERVEDVRGSVVIARSDLGIHVLDENGWDQANDIAMSGVLHARMTADGVASLVRDDAGCQVNWRNDTRNDSVAVDAAVCDSASSFSVDPVTERVFVAFGPDVLTATMDGVVSLGTPGDLLAEDEGTGTVFIASKGGLDVSAFDLDGDPLWTRDVPGPVHAITDMGAMGGTAVVVDTDSGGRLVAHDALTGDKLANYPMPDVAEITFSADASTLAVTLPDTVHFYDVLEGADPIRFNDTETDPPPMFAD